MSEESPRVRARSIKEREERQRRANWEQDKSYVGLLLLPTALLLGVVFRLFPAPAGSTAGVAFVFSAGLWWMVTAFALVLTHIALKLSSTTSILVSGACWGLSGILLLAIWML